MADNPNTADPAKPRRRWYQFRLRTLLIGVVLVAIPCGYVAHEWRIVAERKTWLLDHPQPMFSVDIAVFDGNGNVESPPEPTIPRLRQWLGDEPTKYVEARSSGEEKAARKLFPEATRIFCSFDADSK
jgi:hypothetical protein